MKIIYAHTHIFYTRARALWEETLRFLFGFFVVVLHNFCLNSSSLPRERDISERPERGNARALAQKKRARKSERSRSTAMMRSAPSSLLSLPRLSSSSSSSLSSFAAEREHHHHHRRVGTKTNRASSSSSSSSSSAAAAALNAARRHGRRRRSRRSILPHPPRASSSSGEDSVAARNDDDNDNKNTRFLVVNYHRQESDYDGFGLHVWGDVPKPTEWNAPLYPASSEAEREHAPQFETFKVELEGTNSKIVSVLLHKGEEQDVRAESMKVPSGEEDVEIFLVSGYREIWQEKPDLEKLPKGDVHCQRAILLDKRLVALPRDFNGVKDGEEDVVVELYSSKSGSLKATADGVESHDPEDGDVLKAILSRTEEATIDAAVKEKFPAVFNEKCFAFYEIDESAVSDAKMKLLLKTQLAVGTKKRTNDSDKSLEPLDACGLQIHGALDAFYSYDGPLGCSFMDEIIVITLWAPSAIQVDFLLFDSPDFSHPKEELEMMFDSSNGTWIIHGRRKELYQMYYNFRVTVFHPKENKVMTSIASDPYARSLAADGRRAHIFDVENDASAKPEGWETFAKPRLNHICEGGIYELHVRDFSALDDSVPEEARGKYKAFSCEEGRGARHLKRLSQHGLSHVHLLPTYDFGSVPERAENQKSLSTADISGMEALESDSEFQQTLTSKIASEDAFNWGYDPVHYGVPEGSYSTNPDGPTRILEYREMVKSLSEKMNLRLIVDVVYNHTLSSGPTDVNSVLDKIVPGYYHRRNFRGDYEASTCCNNTASEHYMFDRLIVDDLVHWAKDYKVDGFRFDLMGHIMLKTMLKAKSKLEALTLEKDGVDGSKLYLYGEGWDYAEVVQNRVGANASQMNLANTGIGSFNDRVREGAVGGTPFGDPREQGFATGLLDRANAAQGNDDVSRKYRTMEDGEKIIAAFAGNLREYVFTNRHGVETQLRNAAYENSNVAYAGEPKETVNYVSAHDNETLFDCIALRASSEHTTLRDRIRMNRLCTSIVALSQGVPFFHAGDELLRSKSLDRDSYDSGDWFNRLDFSGETHNFGVGMPPRSKNEGRYDLIRPFLANIEENKPSKDDILAQTDYFCELMSIRSSSKLFSLETFKDVQNRVSFFNRGENQIPGLLVYVIDDGFEKQKICDNFERIVVCVNATSSDIENYAEKAFQRHVRNSSTATILEPHPLQGTICDDADTLSRVKISGGTLDDVDDLSLTIPALSTIVFVQKRC